jgi:hypothetical protein
VEYKTQIEEWVRGNSIHDEINGLCVPDFSCCRLNLKAPQDVRARFAESDDEVRAKMLWIFVSALYADQGRVVEMVGDYMAGHA